MNPISKNPGSAPGCAPLLAGQPFILQTCILTLDLDPLFSHQQKKKKKKKKKKRFQSWTPLAKLSGPAHAVGMQCVIVAFPGRTHLPFVNIWGIIPLMFIP